MTLDENNGDTINSLLNATYRLSKKIVIQRTKRR